MKERVRLTAKQMVDVINEYSNQLTPMIALASKYGISRQGIYKILLKAGIDTVKRKLPVSCTTCGTVIMRNKAKIRRQLHHFCGVPCWETFLEAGNGFPYKPSRHGQRIGRSIVSKYFQLQTEHIVHHEDRNCLSNELKNLRVFATQGDHLRYHRGFDVLPLWNGADINI